jgi:hypothetical protein
MTLLTIGLVAALARPGTGPIEKIALAFIVIGLIAAAVPARRIGSVHQPPTRVQLPGAGTHRDAACAGTLPSSTVWQSVLIRSRCAPRVLLGTVHP